MLLVMELGSVWVGKVKGDATDSMVQQGQVRAQDSVGMIKLSLPATFGRPRQKEEVLDACRALFPVRWEWYLLMLLLRRFIIAVSYHGKPWW